MTDRREVRQKQAASTFSGQTRSGKQARRITLAVRACSQQSLTFLEHAREYASTSGESYKSRSYLGFLS